jgi:hypothetical protein
VPAIPQYIIEPIWEQFCALLPERDADVHPLGCHRRRIPDRLVFDKLVAGARLRRRLREDLRRDACSASTSRRRRDEWIDSGAMEKLRRMALEAYDRIVGLTALGCGRRLLHHQSTLRGRECGKKPDR